MHRTAALLRPSLLKGNSYNHTIPSPIGLLNCLGNSLRYLSNVGGAEEAEQVDVVIIGGGVIGTSIAYHLAKYSQKQVVLLEKTELTAGSTWHAAGLATYFHPGINVKRIHYDSLQLYGQIHKETGQDVGFHRCGSVRLATTPARVDEFKYQMQRHGWHQAPQRLVDPDEIKKLHPLVNTDTVLSGLYNEDDGYVDPYSLTHALGIGARKYGAKIITNTTVKSTEQRGDGGWNIETTKGLIVTQSVVNAAGFWAREVGQLAGIDLPLIPVHHTYLVTSEVPEVVALEKEPPVIRALEASCYARLERSGLLVGPYECEERMKLRDDWYDNGVPPGFGKELFEGDLDSLNDYLVELMEILPVLKEASIRNVICGPITYAVESAPIVGPYQGLANYWVAGGFGYGIIQAGGVGKYLAEWISKGEPSYDLIELDPCRYGWWADRKYVLDKSREAYGLNNIIIYPKEERPAGRSTQRRSAIYETLQDQGAQFGFRTGWEQPNWFALPGDEAGYRPSFYRTNWFEPVRREVALVRENVGVIDVTPAGKFEITGDDAAKLLNYIYANELPKSWEHRTCYMLTPSGKVYGENLVASNGDGKYFCVTGALSELHDLRHLEDVARIKHYKVHIKNVTDTKGCIGLAGPKSPNVLSKLTNSETASTSARSCQMFQLSGFEFLAVNISLTGETGWELYTDSSNISTLYSLIMEAGREFGIGNFGSYAYNALRIESAIPAWGSEMKLDYNVMESRLEDRTSFEKSGDFIGKPSLADLRDGLGQQLVLLSVDTTTTDPEGNETIWKDGQVVGHTTSGCYGYSIGQSLAFAYLPPALTASESDVTVEILGNLCSAKVLPGSPLQESRAS